MGLSQEHCDNKHYYRGFVLEEDSSIVEHCTRDSLAPIRSLTTLLAIDCGLWIWVNA